MTSWMLVGFRVECRDAQEAGATNRDPCSHMLIGYTDARVSISCNSQHPCWTEASSV